MLSFAPEIGRSAGFVILILLAGHLNRGVALELSDSSHVQAESNDIDNLVQEQQSEQLTDADDSLERSSVPISYGSAHTQEAVHPYLQPQRLHVTRVPMKRGHGTGLYKFPSWPKSSRYGKKRWPNQEKKKKRLFARKPQSFVDEENDEYAVVNAGDFNRQDPLDRSIEKLFFT